MPAVLTFMIVPTFLTILTLVFLTYDLPRREN